MAKPLRRRRHGDDRARTHRLAHPAGELLLVAVRRAEIHRAAVDAHAEVIVGLALDAHHRARLGVEPRLAGDDRQRALGRGGRVDRRCAVDQPQRERARAGALDLDRGARLELELAPAGEEEATRLAARRVDVGRRPVGDGDRRDRGRGVALPHRLAHEETAAERRRRGRHQQERDPAAARRRPRAPREVVLEPTPPAIDARLVGVIAQVAGRDDRGVGGPRREGGTAAHDEAGSLGRDS